MRSFLRKLILDNWLRKLISFIIALIIWIVVDQSLSVTKIIETATIRVQDLPQGKTVANLLQSGVLNMQVPIAITGPKRHVADLSANDFDIVITIPENISDEHIMHVGKEHLRATNPNLCIDTHINRVSSDVLTLKVLPKVTETIPVFIDRPTGLAPYGLEFFNVWPYHLNTTISGPAEVINQLKAKGLEMSLDMQHVENLILKEMDKTPGNDIVTFYVPDEWKKIYVPALNDTVEITDPDVGLLRVNFIRSDNIPIEFPIPLYIFSSDPFSTVPQSVYKKIIDNDIIQNIRGIKCLKKPLYTKGVSHKFLETVENMISIFIDISSSESSDYKLNWLIQFINYAELEERYVEAVLNEPDNNDVQNLPTSEQKKYLRTRFRNYVRNFRIFSYETDSPIQLDICSSKGREIIIKEDHVDKR